MEMLSLMAKVKTGAAPKLSIRQKRDREVVEVADETNEFNQKQQRN